MYLPNRYISTHPRYAGSGVFGSIGKVLGKIASKASGEATKKLIKKGISTAGEQASKAILKKSQAVVDENLGKLVNMAIKKVTKPKAKAKAKVKSKSKAVTQPVSQTLSPEATINRLMAGSGNRKPKSKSLQNSDILTLQDIINRGINTPFLPEATTFGSGIKTL
ncbi:MAG: hypothetical protein MI700_14500 [Balneolales bacterium]|nr:hypothetical protein [Balneolales bacterium]